MLEDHARVIGTIRILLKTGVRYETAVALFDSASYSPTPGYVPNRDQHIDRALTKPLSVPQRL